MTDSRLVWIANILGVRSDRLSATPHETRPFDVFLDRKFRVGYFAGLGFWRENPTKRTLHRYGIHVREALVDSERRDAPGCEPQYDLVISFASDGRILFISDNRTESEARSIR